MAETRPAGRHIPNHSQPFKAGHLVIHSFKDGSVFIGRIDAVYADYWAAIEAGAVEEGWFEDLDSPPSTKDQVFYSVVGATQGAILTTKETLVSCEEERPIRFDGPTRVMWDGFAFGIPTGALLLSVAGWLIFGYSNLPLLMMPTLLFLLFTSAEKSKRQLINLIERERNR